MLWFTVRCYLEIDVGPRREGRFFVEIWVRSQAMEGRKREEGRYTRKFTHSAKNSCKGSKKNELYDSRAHLEIDSFTRLNMCVILNATNAWHLMIFFFSS